MAASRTLMALAIVATLVVELAMAVDHTVGDSAGWEIGTDVQSWAASKNFTVGDVISFVYSANHDVVEVKEADFGSCSGSNPIEKHTGGNTAITLSTAGKRFFICGVPGHCTAGMKVQIDTLAASSPPPSSTDAPPSPPPQATPSSPPPATPPPSSTDAPPSPPPIVAPSSPPPASPPTSPPPASPPKSATKPPTKSPLAPSPGSNASPPAPPFKPTPPSSAPTPEPPIPPFPFDQPLIPSAAPTTPPPPPSSAYKCSFMVHFSVGFSFVAIMLLAL